MPSTIRRKVQVGRAVTIPVIAAAHTLPSWPCTKNGQTPHDPQNWSSRGTPKRPFTAASNPPRQPDEKHNGNIISNHRSRRPAGTAVRGTRRHGRHRLNLHRSPQSDAPEAGDPGRKVATLRDCRRQNRPRRRRRSHHQAARTAVPHAGHIRRGERTNPAWRSLPGAGRPRCRPPGGTTDTHQPATPLANSPIPRLRRSPPAGQDHLQQRTKHKQQFLCKAQFGETQKALATGVTAPAASFAGSPCRCPRC